MNNAPIIPDAIMLDAALALVQSSLAELSWLDVAFGKAQRMVKKVGNQQVITPHVYCGGWKGHGKNDYIEVMPDSKIGNFSFFVCDDPVTINRSNWAREYESPFALIVWFDLRRVYGVAANRNIEYLKQEVVKQIYAANFGMHGRIWVDRVYEQGPNIYRGFTLNETQNQSLIHPFGALRIEGGLMYDEFCQIPAPVDNGTNNNNNG